MLGFSALTETPFAQASTVLEALGYLTTNEAQAAAGTVLYDAKAGPILPAATSSITANVFGDVDAKATLQLLDAIASFNINNVNYDAQATHTPSATTALFSLTDLDYDAKANTTLAPAVSSLQANNFADVDAQASANLNSTVAYLTIYITDLADEDAQAKAFMLPVSATGNVNIDYDAQGRSYLGEVFAYSDVSDVDFDAKANITTSSIPLTGVAQEPAYIWGNSRVYPTSVSGKFKLNLDTPLDNSFPYEDYADAYNTGRVFYVLKYESVGTETVFIAPESFTVVIPPYADSSTTVFIDR